MVPPDLDGRSGGSGTLLFELVAGGSGDDGCSRGKGCDGCHGRLDGAPRELTRDGGEDPRDEMRRCWGVRCGCWGGNGWR